MLYVKMSPQSPLVRPVGREALSGVRVYAVSQGLYDLLGSFEFQPFLPCACACVGGLYYATLRSAMQLPNRREGDYET